ncbi:hypothetical protein ACOSQ2_001850 [Xanthoceras sorbifolium]
METEADVTETVSTTQRVGENIYLTSGQSEKTGHETSLGELKKCQETLNLPCETTECSEETENMQKANGVGAETMNTVIKGNVETLEGERFLESPSAVAVATEETSMVSKHCQADEEPIPEDMEMSENKKQMQKNTTNEIAQETESGENKVVEESKEKAEKNDRSHDIMQHAGTSLQAAKIEESNLRIRGEGSLEERYVDQIEVIEDQQDSAEDKSTNKETRDMQKNEKDGTAIDGNSSLESNKQVLNTIAVTLDQNKEASVHIPDPGVISLNKDIETAAEPCNKAGSIKAKFTGDVLGEKSSEVDDKEAEKSTNLVGEEESPEATRLSKRVENEKAENEESRNYSAGDILASRLAIYRDTQSDDESMSKVRHGNKELLYKPSVTPAGDESSVHQAGPETGENLKEVLSISCEEKNNNKIEPSERIEQCPVEEEMNHKNNIDTSFAVQTEETCLRKVENPELLKVVPRNWSDDIKKENPKEVNEIEKTSEGDSTSNEKGKEYVNLEQKEECSFMKHEATSSIIEVMAATDISSGENRDEGGSTVVVHEDNIDDTKITDGLEHNHSGKSNHEERSDTLQQHEPEMEKLDESLSTIAEDFSKAASTKYLETITCDEKEAPIKSHEESLVERIIDASQQGQSGTSNHEERPEQLQQNEPEKEKLDGSSSLVNADFGMTASTEYAEKIPCAQEEAPIKSHEESFEEKIEEGLQTQSGTIIENGIPKNKNIPAIETNEKIDDSEVYVQNKDSSDLQVTYPSVEEAVQNEGQDLVKISNFEPEGQTHEAYKASTEQKHIEDAPEACRSSNCTITEHASTERATSEPIPTRSEADKTKLQEACALDSEENSMIKDSGENKDQEMKTNEEACHTVTHEILAKGDNARKDMIDTEATVEVNRAIFVRDEMVEQKFHIETPLPAAPTLSGEDEIYKPEDNAKTNNITYQQVHDGTNIAGTGEATNEQVTKGIVTYNSLELTEHETDKSSQHIKNEAEKLEGKNNREQIIEDDNIGEVPAPVEQDPIKNLNDETNKADNSTGEVNWTVNQIPSEASPEEKRNEDMHSYHKELVNAKDNIEKTQSEIEEDLQHILPKKKSGENLEELLPVISDDTEIFSSSADKILCLMEKEAPPDLKQTAQKEEEVNETEENNEIKDKKITMEEMQDLKLVAETSEASTESNVLESKSERDKMVVEHDTEKGESRELYKDSKTDGEGEDTEKQNTIEECVTTSILPEPVGEKSLNSFKEDQKEEDRPEIEVCAEPELTSACEDAGRQHMEEENTVDPCKELEVNKIVQSSEEDDTTAKTSKQDNLTYISEESIEQETVENSEGNRNKAEKSEAENRREQTIEEGIIGLIPESIEQDPTQNLNDEKQKTEKSTEEIFENSETAKAVESIAHQTVKTTESPKEILDASPVKQEVNFLSEGKTTEASLEEIKKEDISPVMVAEENSNTNELVDAKEDTEKKSLKNEENLEHILQKNELGEKLEQSLSMMSDGIEVFSSNADKSHSLMVEGVSSQNLEETAQTEDKTEENNEAKHKNIAMEEEPQAISETSEASKSIESIVLEPNSEMDKMVLEDETRKGESEEDLEVVAEASDASKSKESIDLEPKSEMDKMVDGDDLKNEESEELSEDSKDTCKAEDTEKQSIEEACHTTSILPEPIGEKVPQGFAEEENVEETTKIEIFKNFETARASESIAHKTSETSESLKERLDTSPVKQEENLHSEGKTTEASLEEKKNEDISPVMVTNKNSNANELANAKDDAEKKSSKSEEDSEHILKKNEPGENLEQSLPMMPDEIEILSSNADKTPCMVVEGPSQFLEETAHKEDKIVMEEEIKVVVNMSNASKSIESTVLEQESKLDKMVVEDYTKKVESEELYEDSKNASEDVNNEKHSMMEECVTTNILPEPSGVNIHQSVKDVNEEGTPEIEVHIEPDSTSIGEDVEKQITMEENAIEQCRVLEAEKIEQNFEEDDKMVKMSEQGNVTYISVESVESSQRSTNNIENSEAENNKEYTIEDGNNGGYIPESVELDLVKNLDDEKMKAEKSSGEILENSETGEAAESIPHETIETLDTIDTSLENKRATLQSEGDDLTPREASPEEKDEDRSPVTVAQENSSVNEPLDAKDNIEKHPSKTEEDLEHILQKNEPGEKPDQSLSKMVHETEAFSSNSDKIPQLMEEGASQNEEETEQNNETKDSKRAVEEDLKLAAETSDASKSKESIAWEPKSELEDGDDIKNEDSEELSENSKDTGKGDDTEKQNIAIACHTTSILPEPIEDKALQSFAEENKEEETTKIEEREITQIVDESEDTGKQNIEEGSVAENNIEVLVRETDEEDSLKNENKEKEQEEEVDDSNLASIEKIEATSSAKETVSETLKDTAESNVASHQLDVTKASEEEKHPEEVKEDLVEKSVLLSEALYKDSKEEITAKEETKFDYSDSVSVTEVKEEAGLQEAEDSNQLQSFGPVSEEKGIAETETRERTLESGDLKLKPVDTSNLSEMMGKDIPVEAGEDRIDKEMKNEVPHAGNENQEEVTTSTMPLKEIFEDELIEYSTVASEECKLKSSETSKTVEETPENIQAPDENEGTNFVAKAIDEMLMQKHDKTTNPLNVSETRSIETEKETANEAQKHKVDNLYEHPELENEKDVHRPEDVEILKREETRELTDQSDICTSQTLQGVESSDLGLKVEEIKDENPLDEAFNCTESSSTCTEIEKAIIEQEISEGNSHEGINMEKVAIEQKEEAYSQRQEDTSTKDDGTLTEESFKSVDPDQKFEFVSESVAEHQSKQIIPESDKGKIEENDDNKKQQDEKEIKEEEEPASEAEENKEQSADEITKAVLFIENAPGRVEQLDGIEDIKDPVIEMEQDRNELHSLSTVGETTNKDSPLVCNAKVAESKEKTDTENPVVEEDSTRQREAFFARQSEEKKLQDVSIETPAEELEEKKKKILEESRDCCSKNDNATVAIKTAEKSSEQADKLQKASNIDPEPCLETNETENTHQKKEIDIMKPEETSCDLTSNLPTVHDSHAEQESIIVENTEASECEETKMVSEAFYKTNDQSTEETDVGTTVEKKDQVPSYDHDHAEKENALGNSDKDEVEETKIASAADQGAEGILESGKSPTVEIMDQVQSTNSEHAEKENMAAENPIANEVNESKVSSDAIYLSEDQGTEESAGKISTVEIPDQVPVTNSEHAKNESVTEENPDADDADETKMASNVVFKSEDKATKDIDEIRKSPTAEKQDADKNKEASKVASDYRAHGSESVREDEITTDRTTSTEKLEEQLPALTSATTTTTTIDKIEEEKTKKVDMLEGEGPEDSSVAKPTEDICLEKEVYRELDVSTLGLKINKDIQDSPTEVHEEEGQNPESKENNNKIEQGDSSSESKNNTDLTEQTETVCDLKFETSEKTLESEMIMHNLGLTESVDTEIKEKHLVAVITDMRAEEKQLKQASEANEITQNEVINEEITEEKEAAKTHHPISLCEETMSVSLQEDELKAEVSVGEKTNTIYINSANAIQNEEPSVSIESKNIEEQVATEDRSVQDPEQVSVENIIIKESFPNEFEAKDAKDAAIKLDHINQGEETNFESGKTETATPRDKELGIEISQEECIRESVNGSNLIQDIQELENNPCATTEKQISTEADLIESPKTIVSTGNEYAPSLPQEGITEVGDSETGHAKGVHSETKGMKLDGEEITDDSEDETIKEPVKMDTDKASLSALVQTSRKETPDVVEHVTKERELTASPEDLQTEKAENIQIREAKTGEDKDDKEEGDEQQKKDLSSDAPVMVDVTRDMDVKVAHKKSHGILSGVGSKVKHSISKVKKAITGKSSHHPKPVSPK